MEISARRDEDGNYILDMGNIVFTLPVNVLEALNKVLDKRLGQSGGVDNAALQKKLVAYRALATKMNSVSDVVVQKFVTEISPEQLATLVRLSDGNLLYKKVLKNMSKQNARQFEEDYQAMGKVTAHHACVYMEQIIPVIKKAAQDQKQMEAGL